MAREEDRVIFIELLLFRLKNAPISILLLLFELFGLFCLFKIIFG